VAKLARCWIFILSERKKRNQAERKAPGGGRQAEEKLSRRQASGRRKAKEKQDQVRERQGPAGDPSCPREAGGVWLFFRFFLLFLHTVNGVLDRIEGVQVFCCSSITLGYCHLVVEAGLGGIF